MTEKDLSQENLEKGTLYQRECLKRIKSPKFIDVSKETEFNAWKCQDKAQYGFLNPEGGWINSAGYTLDLYHQCLEKGVKFQLGTRVKELIRENGTVKGKKLVE